MTQSIDDIRARKRPSRRTLILWLLALLLAWLIWSRFAELEQIGRTLLEGQIEWIIAAALLQVAYFCSFAEIYRSAFDTVGLRARFRDLLTLTVAAVFANATMMGGAAGTVLFVDDARRRGQSPARATTGTLLVLAADYAAFSVLLTFGLLLLVRLRDLSRIEGIGAAAMYLLTLLVVALLVAGLWAPGPLHGLLGAVQRAINGVSRLIWRENWVRPTWAAENASEFINGSLMLREKPWRVLRTVGIAFVTHLLSLASLCVLFLAFNEPPRLSAANALYAMTIMFTVVAPTPSGAGIVETIMPAIYVSLGVPLEVGTLINLAFRAFNVWLPLLIGFFIMRRLRAFQNAASEAADV